MRLNEPWNVAKVETIEYVDAHPEGVTDVFIQWKGTAVCLDFTCECGASGHLDGFFAYALRCTACGAVYEMPATVYPVKTDDPTHDPIDVRLDDEDEGP